jgi:hypothetical protein
VRKQGTEGALDATVRRGSQKNEVPVRLGCDLSHESMSLVLARLGGLLRHYERKAA